GQFDLVTDVGFILGLSYVLRLFTILISGSILLTSKQKEMIQALIKLKIPYDLAFMSLVGIRFLPLLIEQMQDTFIAIQLRGINISNLKFQEKLRIYSYIFSPVIVSTLKKAKNLAMSVELRGFRVYETRTSLVELKMQFKDYLMLSFMVTVTFGFVFLNIL
ncbi:MAG: energy-coupling factor transporter transmembrane component T family protein, partial [Halanaerobiales bacterium]